MYKNGKYYYTSIQVNNKKLVCSLRTTDKKVAKTREREAKIDLYNQIKAGVDKRKPDIGKRKLVEAYKAFKKPSWALATQRTNKHILNNWLTKKPMSRNINTIESQSKVINAFFNWCNRNYKTEFNKLKFREGYGRTRVFTKIELDKLFNSEIPCHHYDLEIDKDFLRFAYYTGARQGELLNIKTINKGFFVGKGKAGARVIKLTKQAQELIENSNWLLWEDYKPHQITYAFKKYARELGLADAKFKDIRRTFGLDYLLDGGMIYQLSKLLGHRKALRSLNGYICS